MVPPSGGQPGSGSREKADSGEYQLSAIDLLFLAAGGVIGSGWLLTGREADILTGSWGIVSWLVGGILMLIIAAVMVDLSSQQPKTGGLIWLPNQSSGPLLALVLAAGLWAFYAVNPASESTAMVRGLDQFGLHHLIDVRNDSLTGAGIGIAAGFIVAIYVVNLLGFQCFVRLTNILTAIKIAVPVMVVVLLAVALATHAGTPSHHLLGHVTGHHPNGAPDVLTVLTTVTGGGIVYAYLGFQGPLDFAGHVRTDGIGEARRLRRAVIGTVIGSALLYIALQAAVIWSRGHDGGEDPSAPFAFLVNATLGTHTPAADAVIGILNADMILSPAGAALVFTHVLTREVSALSRAGLTHEGLFLKVLSFKPGRRLAWLLGRSRVDAHWLILFVNGIVSVVALTAAGGNWITLGGITGILSLMVYASPSVVLLALDRTDEGYVTLGWGRRVLARAAFVCIGLVFFMADWNVLWKGLAALLIACALLFGLPVLSARRGWYAAHSHAGGLLRWKTNPSAQAALTWLGYYTLLALGGLPFFRRVYPHFYKVHELGKWQFASLVPVVLISLVVFEWLVVLSARRMVAEPPEGMPRPARKAEQVPSA